MEATKKEKYEYRVITSTVFGYLEANYVIFTLIKNVLLECPLLTSPFIALYVHKYRRYGHIKSDKIQLFTPYGYVVRSEKV